MRLLVVEDEVDLGQAVAEHLRAVGYVADHVVTLEDARTAILTTPFSLILLDLSLPDGNGLTLLREIRAKGIDAGILIATARDRIMERIAGLDAGADDYLVKPYDLDEMVARVAAVLRRGDDGRATERVFGALLIRPGPKTVIVGNREVTLTRKEWALLDRLSRRPEIVVSKADLEDDLYGYGSEVESNAVEVHISRLRAKLGSKAVETVRGFGYRMGKV